MGAVQQGTTNMNGSPSFLLNWNLFGNNNGSPLFQQFDWSNLSLPLLTSNGSPLNNNLPYYPFGGNYYIDPIFRRTTNGSPASASGVDDGTSSISAGTAGLDKTDTIFDTDNNNNSNTFGLAFGNIFSSGLSSAGNKILNNIVKGETFGKGVVQDASSTISGAVAGLGSNMVGKGITSLMGNSKLGKGVGQGIATGLGIVGGRTLQNIFKPGSAMSMNPYTLGAHVIGSGLLAAFGPSKEYGGKYGNITQTMDTIYDSASAIAGTMGPIGMGVSGFMTLNKGLSNIFGSTDGMCVCAGTKVYTASGEIINIEDLVQSLGIIGWNENTHEIRPNTIKGIVEPRQKECLEIELKNGITLRCSIDHPILSNNKPKAESHRINGKRIAYREWKFRRADELKIGDFVGLANNIDYWGTVEMPNAYLVGMLIGDGTYTYENSCRLCSVDPSTWKYIEENNLGVINNCSGIDPNKYNTEYRTYRIINGMQLMKDLGIAYLSGTNKTLPKNLGKYNKDSICKMIAGLYDTDGSISVNEEKGTYKITFYLSNLNLLYDLRDLLHKLGIFSTVYTRKASINKLANGKIINSNLSYRLEITDMYSADNFYKNIPLNIDYKKEYLERIHQMLLNKKPQEHNELSGAKQYKIVSIKPIGILTVYNLEAVEDHTYIANGIITHNTKTDAILGSAFMPAPVKWLNMLGSSKTGTFNNQSWQNSEQANSFMLNGFGNLNEKFQRAMEEAGKRYGTFSQGAKKRALKNIDFANTAWEQVLQMAAQNRLLNIRSLDMTSINNLKYTQWIQGGWSPSLVGRGKQGMKIFNNATNHNIGMRLLSSAALIDNKQMILSFQGGGKPMRPRMKPHAKGEKPVYTEEEKKLQAEWDAHLKEVEKQRTDKIAKRTESNIKGAERFNQQANLVLTAMNQQANETPFTGQAYQQAVENLRLEKIEKFHEKAEELGKGFEAALMADLAVSAAPLLLRGFRWAFNKAGLLVKVPVLRSTQLPSGITKTVLDNGKIRLSLPSHTKDNPRQFVLEPQGDNKFYVHMRTWDGDHIPANITNKEKQQLFDALYNELPEGAEILFPKSGPGYYGTRGTVAGLQRLSKDPRFTPGTKGTLQYLDKDGKTVRTYEGTSFIKAPRITEANAASITPKVNWDTDNWFKTISGRNSYSQEEAAELASHIPEYREIEKRLFDEGKLIIDSKGNITVKGSKMSPLEYIMRQSKAFQKMNPEHHYTGVPKHNIEYFEENPVDVESWSDRISPKNVEEYAFGNFKTRKEILDNIKYLEDLENKNGITESTQDWLKIYRLLLEDFDANIKLMKAKNHGRVYDITYPNGLNTFNMDALGNHWARIPSEIPAKAGISRRYLRPGEVATDDIVSASNEIEPSIVNIDNVMDTYDGTLLNETIIPRFVPKKSVLGSTGNFDLSNPSLFRSLIPLTVGGLTAATLHNKSK